MWRRSGIHLAQIDFRHLVRLSRTVDPRGLTDLSVLITLHHAVIVNLTNGLFLCDRAMFSNIELGLQSVAP